MTVTDLLSESTTVSRLATRVPAASRVFMRHQIDFCCGGNRPLATACAELGIATSTVLEQIRAEEAKRVEPSVDWAEQPLADLIQHIVQVYHLPLREELPRLLLMARKVNGAHGEKDPQRLAELVRVLETLGVEMFDHLEKEEQILFPMIGAGHGRDAGGPVQAMLEEHDDTAAALATLRQLTDDYVPPKGACTTWRALWASLEAFDRETRMHMHLENNILFPRALGQAAA